MGAGVGNFGTMKSSYFSRSLPFLFFMESDGHLPDFERRGGVYRTGTGNGYSGLDELEPIDEQGSRARLAKTRL